MTLQDQRQLAVNTVYYVQLSPDGRELLYATWGHAGDGEDPEDLLWLVSTAPGSTPRKIGRGTLARWSPDGRSIAFLSAGPGRQLQVMDLATRTIRPLTAIKGGITTAQHPLGWLHDALQFSWSPDGSRIVFASLSPKGPARPITAGRATAIPGERKDGAPLVLTGETPRDWTIAGIYRVGRQVRSVPLDGGGATTPTVSQLFIADRRTGAVRRLTRDTGQYFNPDWSPDGRSIVAASGEGRPLAGPNAGGTNLYLIDVATGAKRAVTASQSAKFLPSFSPNGKLISFFEVKGTGSIGVQRPVVISSEGGEPKYPGAEITQRLYRAFWLGDDKLLMSFDDGGANRLATVDLATDRLDRIEPNAQVTFGLYAGVSRAGSIAWIQSDEAHSGVIRLLEAGQTVPRTVADANPQLAEIDLGAQELVRWRNSRGDELEGVLIKPPGFDANQKYPMIVDCYPGYGKVLHQLYDGDMGGSQALAARGYLIFFPAWRAPHVWMNLKKSEAFMNEVKGPQGWDVAVDDIMSGVDEVIRRGYADPDRMGLLGFSNGGGIVDYLVTATDRFKAAVSVAPVVPDWLTLFFGYTLSDAPAFAGTNKTPWDDLEGYVKLSAVYRLPKVTTPMLLAAGDEDRDFLLGILEMYNGLRWLGKDVTLLRYPGEGHGFKGAALEDFWQRETAFFDSRLK